MVQIDIEWWGGDGKSKTNINIWENNKIIEKVSTKIGKIPKLG